MIKKLLPLLCAVVMIAGSSMTVFAYSSLPSDVTGNCAKWIYSNKTWCVFTDGYLYADSNDYLRINNYCYYKMYYLDNDVWVLHAEDSGRTVGNYGCKNISKVDSMLYSNVNIYYGDENGTVSESEDNLFFQNLPVAAKAVKESDLLEVITTQSRTVTIIAIFCLALVIGSTVLVPRLRRYLS